MQDGDGKIRLDGEIFEFWRSFRPFYYAFMYIRDGNYAIMIKLPREVVISRSMPWGVRVLGVLRLYLYILMPFAIGMLKKRNSFKIKLLHSKTAKYDRSSSHLGRPPMAPSAWS